MNCSKCGGPVTGVTGAPPGAGSVVAYECNGCHEPTWLCTCVPLTKFLEPTKPIDKPEAVWSAPTIEDGRPNRYGWVVRHPQFFKLGFNTDIGYGTYIQALNGVTIEENVQIGSHCSIYSESTINNKHGPVLLKKNCRIGSHSVIMPGVTVGENAVVGAFSYITHDVAANTIVYPKQELIIKDREII